MFSWMAIDFVLGLSSSKAVIIIKTLQGLCNRLKKKSVSHVCRALVCDQNGRICDSFWRMCELKFDVVTFVRVHGLRCSKAPAPYSARCWAGVRFHRSREERCCRERFRCRAWFTCCVSNECEGALSVRQKWCECLEMMADERFGFQAKVK